MESLIRITADGGQVVLVRHRHAGRWYLVEAPEGTRPFRTEPTGFGMTTKEAAEKHGVTPGTISEFRSRLKAGFS